MNSSTLIEHCFGKKVLLNRAFLNSLLEKEVAQETLNKINPPPSSLILILNQDSFLLLEKETPLETGLETAPKTGPDIDWLEFDKIRVALEKNQEEESYSAYLDQLAKTSLLPSPSLPTSPPSSLFPSSLLPLKILTSYENPPKKYIVKDFTRVFVSRYHFLAALLRTRPELPNLLSVNKLLNKKEKETVSLIALVSEISQTYAGNLLLTLEDPTGQLNVIVNKNKPELYLQARDLVLDEVIGLTGTSQGKTFFAESFVWPEVPLNRELRKAPQEAFALFLSDIHVGSANFLTQEFHKFLDWLNGKVGSSAQKEIAQKVKYIFIVGDLVDGVGIYPAQDKELVIKDIYQQYQAAADLLKKIPPFIQIIICPGNHDALYLAEPQAAFNPKYIQPLTQIPNLTLVSNPAWLNILQTPDFPGFDILLYHGFSFDYYVAQVDSLRSQGGYSRADLLMKFLLKRRHLAPSFTSTPYLPSSPEDPLLIKKIPDFFITGHIHYAVAANHRHITMISGSCWQSKTSFQEKVGHEPQPARVPIVNLKTREIKILKFM